MATLQSGLRVPPEIIYLILANCDETENLSVASLVSRTWYWLAFPHLHRCMLIRNSPRLENLTSRLESEIVYDDLRIGLCLRSLAIDFEESDDDFDLEKNRPLVLRFQQMLKKLERLEHLEWTGISIPPGVGFFESFRDSCPNLRMLTISRCEMDDVADELNHKIFGLKNMTHLEISWGPLTPMHPSRVSSAMLDAIENSPDLVKLELELTSMNWEDPIAEWLPSEFFRHLNNPLSKLRQFKIGGSPLIDWGSFTNTARACALRSFFEEHPRLDAIHFDWDHQSEGASFDPNLVHRLFPSVQNFTGPISMCTALVASPLSRQLETLVVLHEELNESFSCSHQDTKALVEAIKHLPNLRELEFLCYGYRDPRPECRFLGANDLETILSATPRLAAFSVEFFHTEFDDMLHPLRHVPLLTELSIRHMGPYTLEKSMLARLFVLQAMKTCPCLRYVHLMSYNGIISTLTFTRFFDGSITVRLDY